MQLPLHGGQVEDASKIGVKQATPCAFDCLGTEIVALPLAPERGAESQAQMQARRARSLEHEPVQLQCSTWQRHRLNRGSEPASHAWNHTAPHAQLKNV